VFAELSIYLDERSNTACAFITILLFCLIKKATKNYSYLIIVCSFSVHEYSIALPYRFYLKIIEPISLIAPPTNRHFSKTKGSLLLAKVTICTVILVIKLLDSATLFQDDSSIFYVP
jgi:hypothetical protein